MDKLDARDDIMSLDEQERFDKINELVDGNNEMKANLKAMSYYSELDRRLKRLEKIEVKRMLDNQ